MANMTNMLAKQVNQEFYDYKSTLVLASAVVGLIEGGVYRAWTHGDISYIEMSGVQVSFHYVDEYAMAFINDNFTHYESDEWTGVPNQMEAVQVYQEYLEESPVNLKDVVYTEEGVLYVF